VSLPLFEALAEIDLDLRQLRVRWALLGGLAVSIRSEPRTTKDIDLAIAVDDDREAERIIGDFMARGYQMLHVAKTLIRYEKEAVWLQGSRSWPVVFCHNLAKSVQCPDRWLGTFLDERTPSRLVLPFLKRVIEKGSEGWENSVKRCFDQEDYAEIAVQVVLPLESAPEYLLRMALGRVSRRPLLVRDLALRNEVSTSTLMALLRHSDVEVGLHAAMGEWYAKPRGKVRPEVRAAWRLAILRSAEEIHRSIGVNSYLLREILVQDSELACEWLGKLLAGKNTAFPDLDLESVVTDADFDDRQRLALLDQMPAGPMASVVISRLIAGQTEVYRELLGQDRLKAYHLHPLEGLPGPAWSEMALVALDHGYDPAEIFIRSFQERGATVVMIWGRDQDHWRRWETAFAALEKHPDARLREIARLGREEARERIRATDARQREFNLTGKVSAPFGLPLSD